MNGDPGYGPAVDWLYRHIAWVDTFTIHHPSLWINYRLTHSHLLYNRPQTVLTSMQTNAGNFVEQVRYRQAEIRVRNTCGKFMQRKKQGLPIFPMGSSIYWENGGPGSPFHRGPQNFDRGTNWWPLMKETQTLAFHEGQLKLLFKDLQDFSLSL